jgi:hypothetical protein
MMRLTRRRFGQLLAGTAAFLFVPSRRSSAKYHEALTPAQLDEAARELEESILSPGGIAREALKLYHEKMRDGQIKIYLPNQPGR